MTQALDYLRSYIADTGISGRVKIWIAGYSRSAAVANMVSGALDNGYSLGEGVSLSPHDLYAIAMSRPWARRKIRCRAACMTTFRTSSTPTTS